MTKKRQTVDIGARVQCNSARVVTLIYGEDGRSSLDHDDTYEYLLHKCIGCPTTVY